MRTTAGLWLALFAGAFGCSTGEPITLSVSEGEDGFERLTIRNDDLAPACLRASADIVALELDPSPTDPDEVEQHLEAHSVRGRYFLVEDCAGALSAASEHPGTVQVPSGDALEVFRWSGYIQSPQCQRSLGRPGLAPPDFAAASGRYQFVVTTCAGDRVESPAFEHRSPEDRL